MRAEIHGTQLADMCKGFDNVAQDQIKAKYLDNRTETKNYSTLFLRIMKN